jgi:hypothetical protein
MRDIRYIALAAALAAAAGGAHAGVRLSAFTSPSGFYVDSPTPAFLPLNDAGATTVKFRLPSAKRLAVTYSAICSVKASEGDDGQWLDLDIHVNGTVVPATAGGLGRICASNETAILADGLTRASITVPINARKGDNSLRIEAKPSGYALGYYVQESQLVIQD